MLPPYYRIQVVNNTGVALAAGDSITVTAVRAKLDTTGAYAKESTAGTLVSGGASLGSGSALNGTAQDNSTNGWFEGQLAIAATVSTATPNGTLDFYMQESNDTGTTWPDNGTGELIASLPFTATGTQRNQGWID